MQDATNIFETISTELMKQETATGLFTGKQFNTISENVVGKWCAMVRMNNKNVAVGFGVTEPDSIEDAKNQLIPLINTNNLNEKSLTNAKVLAMLTELSMQLDGCGFSRVLDLVEDLTGDRNFNTN
jgi:hypothetical protein